jgi:hypothetical protein
MCGANRLRRPKIDSYNRGGLQHGQFNVQKGHQPAQQKLATKRIPRTDLNDRFLLRQRAKSPHFRLRCQNILKVAKTSDNFPFI